MKGKQRERMRRDEIKHKGCDVMKLKPPMRDWSFIDPQGAMRKSIFKIKRTECDNYFAG
jgi:hypothetical protein